MEKINIGVFNEVVYLLEEQKTIGNSGEVISKWERVKKIYASVDLIDTTEQTEDNNIIALTRIEVITYRQKINQRWRIEYKDEIYNISSITPYINSLYCNINAVKILQNGK